MQIAKGSVEVRGDGERWIRDASVPKREIKNIGRRDTIRVDV